MILKEIRAKAKEMGIAASKMKKAELIKTIQQAEGNISCYRERQSCDQTTCCWQHDCTAEITA